MSSPKNQHAVETKYSMGVAGKLPQSDRPKIGDSLCEMKCMQNCEVFRKNQPTVEIK